MVSKKCGSGSTAKERVVQSSEMQFNWNDDIPPHDKDTIFVESSKVETHKYLSNYVNFDGDPALTFDEQDQLIAAQMELEKFAEGRA